MSAPFSDTHLRVPRGFASLLEGLAREVLRGQPEDIPLFAAQHFASLLKHRQGHEALGQNPRLSAPGQQSSGDPDDGLRNKADHENKPATEESTSKEKSYKSQTEDVSAEAMNVSSTRPNVCDEAAVTEHTEEGGGISIEEGLPQSESGMPVGHAQSNEGSGTETEKDPTVASPWVDNANTDADPEMGNVNTKVGGPAQECPWSGQADMNVHATELPETGRTVEDNNRLDEESSKSRSLSQSDSPDHQQVAEVQAEEPKEQKGTVFMKSGFGSLDPPKQDSLVEISFKEVPEPRRAVENQPEGEVPHPEVMQIRDSESEEQNESDTQVHGEPDMERAPEEVNSKREEVEGEAEVSASTFPLILPKSSDDERPLGSGKGPPEREGQGSDEQEECSRPQEEEDIMDIPLDDPEANRAAAKIQAGFRGHMTRKKMKPEDKVEGEERQEDRGQ